MTEPTILRCVAHGCHYELEAREATLLQHVETLAKGNALIEKLQGELAEARRERDEACRYRDAKASGTFWPTIAQGIAEAEARGWQAAKEVVLLALGHGRSCSCRRAVEAILRKANAPVCDQSVHPIQTDGTLAGGASTVAHGALQPSPPAGAAPPVELPRCQRHGYVDCRTTECGAPVEPPGLESISDADLAEVCRFAKLNATRVRELLTFLDRLAALKPIAPVELPWDFKVGDEVIISWRDSNDLPGVVHDVDGDLVKVATIDGVFTRRREYGGLRHEPSAPVEPAPCGECVGSGKTRVLGLQRTAAHRYEPCHRCGGSGKDPEGSVLVYCKVCHKTHAARPGEKECGPGAWAPADR